MKRLYDTGKMATPDESTVISGEEYEAIDGQLQILITRLNTFFAPNFRYEVRIIGLDPSSKEKIKKPYSIFVYE